MVDLANLRLGPLLLPREYNAWGTELPGWKSGRNHGVLRHKRPSRTYQEPCVPFGTLIQPWNFRVECQRIGLVSPLPPPPILESGLRGVVPSRVDLPQVLGHEGNVVIASGQFDTRGRIVDDTGKVLIFEAVGGPTVSHSKVIILLTKCGFMNLSWQTPRARQPSLYCGVQII